MLPNGFFNIKSVADITKVVFGGKQIEPPISFKGAPALLLATYAAWQHQSSVIPDELIELREHLAAL